MVFLIVFTFAADEGLPGDGMQFVVLLMIGCCFSYNHSWQERHLVSHVQENDGTPERVGQFCFIAGQHFVNDNQQIR